MPDTLQPYRRLCTCPSEAIRWACILEATAPKAGNVFPGRPFDDLTYRDFIAAADITADCFKNDRTRISQRMLNAVAQVQDTQLTNVNLGIVLLLGPLVAADEAAVPSNVATAIHQLQDWHPLVSKSLSVFDNLDGENIFKAIRSATAGGMGSSESLDVNHTHEHVDIHEAMHLAKDRDQIARQYTNDFRELIFDITPIVSNCIASTNDLLLAICQAQIHLLTRAPDTLIARKNGIKVAIDVQNRARRIDPMDHADMTDFDQYLRSKGHQLNPGTTADMIAAALYLLLRTNPLEKNDE